MGIKFQQHPCLKLVVYLVYIILNPTKTRFQIPHSPSPSQSQAPVPPEQIAAILRYDAARVPRLSSDGLQDCLHYTCASGNTNNEAEIPNTGGQRARGSNIEEVRVRVRRTSCTKRRAGSPPMGGSREGAPGRSEAGRGDRCVVVGRDGREGLPCWTGSAGGGRRPRRQRSSRKDRDRRLVEGRGRLRMEGEAEREWGCGVLSGRSSCSLAPSTALTLTPSLGVVST